MSIDQSLKSCDLSPEATHSMYDPIASPPFFDIAEAEIRHQVFLANGYQIIGGICIVDKDEYDSNLRRVLSFHEKSSVHLANGALLGPYVMHLGGNTPITFRGVRFFMPDPTFNKGENNERTI